MRDDGNTTSVFRVAHPAIPEIGSIFAVTAIHAGEEPRRRMFGYFFKEETARTAVEGNWLDMHECGHYDHVVIERVPPGIHPLPEEIQWYRWDPAQGWYEIAGTAGSWQPSEKPENLRNTINFCFG